MHEFSDEEDKLINDSDFVNVAKLLTNCSAQIAIMLIIKVL